MSIANKLYDVPHGQEGSVNAVADLPSLYVDGTLANANSQLPYEGRLQIHNAVGACSVKLLSGDLPPGHSLSVDNSTLEVVVRWPAYVSATATLPNANFSEGDKGWDKGTGWSIIEGNNVLDPSDSGNSWEGLFVHQMGESSMMSQSFIKAEPGKSYTASIDVQTGGAREHSHGAAVRLAFYDANGNKIGGDDGNVVKQTTGDGWATSSLTITSPPNTATIKGGVASYRMHQDIALWVDNFKWNVQQDSQGTNVQGDIPLSIEVKDSSGRTADWSGVIHVGSYAVSSRYWRLWITANCDPGSGSYINLSLLALQAQSGGVNQCVGSGGTATQSSELNASYGSINAFENPNLDGTLNPNGYFWHTADQDPDNTSTLNEYGGHTPSVPWWAAFDFGVGKSVLVSDITFVPTNRPGRWPVDFEVQISDDGNNWTSVMSVVGFKNGDPSQCPLGVPQTIVIQPPQ